jgi:hypothetical protein
VPIANNPQNLTSKNLNAKDKTIKLQFLTSEVRKKSVFFRCGLEKFEKNFSGIKYKK